MQTGFDEDTVIVDSISLLQSLQELRNGGGNPSTIFNTLIPKMQKPIMSEGIETCVLDALAQYQNREQWNKWGMSSLREQGSAILLEGPSGTGKTTIARWMANKIKKGFKQLNAADIGGGEPGSTERALREFFADCRRRHNATIFMDECDGLLLSRELIGEAGSTWQLGTIEELMMQMNVYPGLVIAATNHVEKLDPALANRFLSIVHVHEPDYEMRIRLWKQKVPDRFPFQPSPSELKTIAKHELNGRQIETVLIAAASSAIRKARKPNLASIINFCQEEKAKHIEASK